MSRIEVQIMGQSYVLASPDGGEEALVVAANKVDVAMCSIRDAGKIKARERIAVLACLNMAFESGQPTVGSDGGSAAHAIAEPSLVTPNPALTSLIKKLDDALAQDGQLL